MRLLGRILENDARRQNAGRQQILPALRLFAGLLFIFLCALSRNAVFVLIILAAELLRLALLPAPRIAGVLRALALPVLFTLLIMLPSVFLGQPRTLLTVTMKVSCSVLILLLLNEGMDWKALTGAFRSLGVPAIFTATLDMTVRFLVLLGRRANAMLEAISLRTAGSASAGKNRHAGGKTADKQRTRARYRAAGGVLGTTFLVSSRLAQQTYEAMECRGYDGVYKGYARHKAGWRDALYALLIPLGIALFLYCQSLMT